jgi:peptide/nickel transport system permease protein
MSFIISSQDPDLLDPLPPRDGLEAEEAPATETAKRIRTVRHGRKSFYASIAFVVLLAFLALFAKFLPFVQSPTKGSVIDGKLPPSMDHWMGTDQNGRDIFARVIYGARVSLAIGGVSVVIGLFFGGVLGLVSGYYRKKIDTTTSIVMDIILAFPPLILALAIVTFMGRSATNIVLALSILAIPALTRLVRANTLVYAQREFVLAAKSLGAKNGRIIFREILPNVVPPMLSFALTGLAVLIVAEGALAYLGVSVPPPTPTWGAMIWAGRDQLDKAWWISMMPAAVMFVTILSINLIGDTLSERFSIREAIG